MKQKRHLFPEKTLAQAPVGYRFMRSFRLEELQKIEEPVPSSYSRKHASKQYPSHYCYKPLSRFWIVDLYQK